MKKIIKPSPPIAKEPRLQKVEQLARQRIADIKQVDLEMGSEESATLSLHIDGIDADTLRGIKVQQGTISGHETTYGTPEEKEEYRNKIRETVIKLRIEHPEWLEKQIESTASEQLRVCTRTIRQYKK